MPSAEREVTIARPVGDVFAFVADGLNAATWRPGVLDISLASGTGLGAVYKQGVKGPGGRRIAADYRVTAFELNRRLSFETIKDVCLNGPGHFLGSEQTLQLMETEYLYPGVGDRKSPNEWNEMGGLDVAQRALAKVEEILGHHFPSHVAEAVDAEIRRRFPVKLDRSHMQPSADAAVTRRVGAG